MGSSETGRQYRHVYELDVAGSHLPERQKAVLAANLGQVVELRREPDNTYDANAVAVYLADQQLGYVPATEAPAIAAFLDRGELVEAHIDSTYWREDTSSNVVAARLFVGIGLPDPGVDPIHHVAIFGTTAGDTPSHSEGERTLGTSEKMEKAGAQMQKAGCNMTACGCSVVILVVIGFLLYAVVGC